MNKFCSNIPKEILKKYKIIAFDWDGTAVVDRTTDASSITKKLDELLKLGIYVVIITGTNFNNINNQSASFINGPQKQNLFICTNRGSEVFGYNDKSELILMHRRIATDEENNLLDKVAEKTKLEIESISNAKINIIYNRLNRRKIDLIPEWPNPLKSEIDKLIIETENRLNTYGFAGGIKKAYKLLENIAKTSGLASSKITTDVKHLEIGLTDKGDSIKWIIKNLAQNNNISNNEILIGGDEFGPIAGFAGSDSKMILNSQQDITYISVGIEPNGVPKNVIHLAGGPECFEEILGNLINI